jgi:hypothetical protein
MSLSHSLLSRVFAVLSLFVMSGSLWASQTDQAKPSSQSEQGDPSASPRMKVIGQELMDSAETLEGAIFLLFAKEVTVEELDWLISVRASLEAWARVHNEEWGQITYDTLLSEGTKLSVWEELEIDWQTYFTAMLKLSSLPEFGPEGSIDLDELAGKVAGLKEIRDGGESTEEELIALEETIAMFETLHHGLLNYPQSNRDLLNEKEELITDTLARMVDGRPLDRVPPVVIELPEWEVKVLSSGDWKKTSKPDVLNLVYELEGLNANLVINSNAWVEGMKLDDEFMGVLEQNVIGTNLNSELLGIGHWTEGELSCGFIEYSMPGKVRGATFIVTHKDRLLVFSFNGLESDWPLLKPLYDELILHLQVGPQPAPVLANREEFGYQLRADEPWVLKEEGGESVDAVIEYADSGVSVNVAVSAADGLEVIEMWILEMVQEQLAAGYADLEVLQQEVVEHLGKSSGMTEFIATVGVEGSDIEPIKVHIKQLITIHADRIYFITATAPAGIWAEHAEAIDKVLQEMLFL